MKILQRDYNKLDVSKIKGIEKLENVKSVIIDDSILTRFIVVLDDKQYCVNADGEPEMTQDAQKEYDDFVAKIRQMYMRDEITVIDEGYGVDEDELEWHITVGLVDPEDENHFIGLYETDTCVRTEEGE
jgi:hypothetical protein